MGVRHAHPRPGRGRGTNRAGEEDDVARALVVVESAFGNTRAVADAVAVGLRRHLSADVVDVADAPAELAGDVVLLVAGGPTHAFSMSRPQSREDAAQQGASGSTEVGLREWLDRLQPATVAAATFDTKIHKKFLPGSAARAAQKRLHARGFPTAAPARSFWVSGTTGPLEDGEVDRATTWGEELGAVAVQVTGR